jgi:hypothetical protein
MNSKYLVRKIHRYFGVIIGIQFLLWTVGGLYFAWSNIEEIRGNHIIHHPHDLVIKDHLKSPSEILSANQIASNTIKAIRLSNLFNDLFYEIHTSDKMLMINSETGILRNHISELEAKLIVKNKLKTETPIISTTYVTNQNIDDHFQYRGSALPAWAVKLDDESNTTIYVCAVRGTVQKVRTKQWRIFDYLWMLHIMDYNERDNINNTILRTFSVLGMITIISGFVLFYQSSRTIKRIKSSI